MQFKLSKTRLTLKIAILILSRVCLHLPTLQSNETYNGKVKGSIKRKAGVPTGMQVGNSGKCLPKAGDLLAQQKNCRHLQPIQWPIPFSHYCPQRRVLLLFWLEELVHELKLFAYTPVLKGYCAQCFHFLATKWEKQILRNFKLFTKLKTMRGSD